MESIEQNASLSYFLSLSSPIFAGVTISLKNVNSAISREN